MVMGGHSKIYPLEVNIIEVMDGNMNGEKRIAMHANPISDTLISILFMFIPQDETLSLYLRIICMSSSQALGSDTYLAISHTIWYSRTLCISTHGSRRGELAHLGTWHGCMSLDTAGSAVEDEQTTWRDKSSSLKRVCGGSLMPLFYRNVQTTWVRRLGISLRISSFWSDFTVQLRPSMP